jgi:predicted RNase H-like nuclease (RuvC/YqgF family)
MENSNLWTVLITAITVLGSTSAFRYYEKRALHKERDDDFIRHDCKDRISKLEALLEESAREKDDLRNLILKLTSEVAELRTKVEFLTQENEKLKKLK